MKEVLLILIAFIGILTLDSLHNISQKVTPAPCYIGLPGEPRALKFIPESGDRCYAGIIEKDTIGKIYSISCSDTVLTLGPT